MNQQPPETPPETETDASSNGDGKDKDLTYKPLSLDFAEAALVKSLWWGNLITFVLVSAGALALVPWQSAVSVMVGGAIALLNFRLLQRTIGRALSPRQRAASPLRQVLLKYYLRFAATALVLFILVRQGYVEPLGLLAGLSVVVVTILAWGAWQAKRFWNQGL